MSKAIENIRRDLVLSSDEKVKKSGEKFFKEPVKFYGVRSALVHVLAKEHYKNLPDKSKSIVFDLCGELWQSGYLEESIIACDWSYYVHKQYTTGDFKIFGKWVSEYVSNWASCDTLCNHSVGTLTMMYPECLAGLKKWALSENRWVRRAAAVSLIIPARKGLFLNEIFEIADILIMDKDDLVQKGYGWMLKAASQAYQKDVFDYVMRNRARMPRTSLRYSIEKMTFEMRNRAMKKEVGSRKP
jgi:3-methyladenine DNA glycosylase AlkD